MTAPSWEDSSSFYPGPSGAPFGSLSVHPMALSNIPYVATTMSEAPCYDASMSLPTSQAGFYTQDMLQTSPLDVNHFPNLTDTFRHGYPTPPDDIFHREIQELFLPEDVDQNIDFEPLPEAESECEFLGPAKNQPYRSDNSMATSRSERLTMNRGPRPSQPRPIRSASEKNTYNQCFPGLPDTPPKDDQFERGKGNPRNDPRYEAKPDKNGNYHCPYAREGACQHKPTKQKCIYA